MIAGPQGSGKGTQAAFIAARLGIPHISPGQLFRLAKQAGTPLGRQAADYIDAGKLVPLSVAQALMEERLREPDAQKGYILDTYPRNAAQADAFDQHNTLDAVVELMLDDDAAVARLADRRVCPRDHTYHLQSHPPKQPGVCDVDGLLLTQRADDQEELIRKRLATYREETEPLIDRYRDRGARVVRIDAAPPILEVRAALESALGRL